MRTFFSCNMEIKLWIVLLAVFQYGQGRGVPVTGTSSDQLRHSLKSGNNEIGPRGHYPSWNPLLVGLIQGYLSGRKAKQIEFIAKHTRQKRDIYNSNYKKSGGGFSSYPQYKDPFHPLAYPMKGSSYSLNSKAKSSVIYPFDSTNIYDSDPYFKKKGIGFNKVSQGAKNLGFFERPYSNSRSSYSGNGFGRSGPNRSYGRSSYGNSRHGYGGSGFSSNYGGSNFDMSFPNEMSSMSMSSFGNSFDSNDRSSLGMMPNVDLKSLASLYGNIFRGSSLAGLAGAAPAQAAPASAPAPAPAIQPRILLGTDKRALSTDPSAPVLNTGVTVPSAALATIAVPVTDSSETVVLRTGQRTSSPCDALFTTSLMSGFSSHTTTRRPCYYAQQQRIDPTTAPPTTTPCYEKHGTTGTVFEHYHADHETIESFVTGNYAATTTATPGSKPEWSQFEIVQDGVFNVKYGNKATTTTMKTLIPDMNRQFFITQSPVTRYITTPSPGEAYDGQGENKNKLLTPEILDLSNLYPTDKEPHLTGTIEVKREKNSKPRFVVKLPFDTGKMPLFIRRLIVAKFSSLRGKKSAGNGVTMEPLCLDDSKNCSVSLLSSLDDNAVDIIAEVDPTLFDKESFRKAFMHASSNKHKLSTLDLEELNPLNALKSEHHQTADLNNKATRYLEPLPAQHADDLDENDLITDTGEISPENWLEMMSHPTTENPLLSEISKLPAETPEWLRKIINRFAKDQNWGRDTQTNTDAVGNAIPRLLPANDHVKMLPQAQRMNQYSSGSTSISWLFSSYVITACIVIISFP